MRNASNRAARAYARLVRAEAERSRQRKMSREAWNISVGTFAVFLTLLYVAFIAYTIWAPA